MLALLVLLPPLPYGSAEPGVDRDKLLTLLLEERERGREQWKEALDKWQ